MKVCKLTRSDRTTHGGMLWGRGVRNETSGEGELCGPGWVHWYHDPLLAVLHVPIHVCFGPKARLWEAEAEGIIREEGYMKGGSTVLTTIREIPLPVVTLAQRVRYAILCGQVEIGDDCPVWSAWADDWLAGKNRSSAGVARAAWYAASGWAAMAAATAARAADSADSAMVVAVARASDPPAVVAREARAAESAVAAAEMRGKSIDLLALARRAVADEPGA
ncbi:MAG: hypothetical protein V2A79_19060 [Planctomycetota bacterium]